MDVASGAGVVFLGAVFLVLALAGSFFFAVVGFAVFFPLLFLALAFFMPRNLP